MPQWMGPRAVFNHASVRRVDSGIKDDSKRNPAPRLGSLGVNIARRLPKTGLGVTYANTHTSLAAFSFWIGGIMVTLPPQGLQWPIVITSLDGTYLGPKDARIVFDDFSHRVCGRRTLPEWRVAVRDALFHWHGEIGRLARNCKLQSGSDAHLWFRSSVHCFSVFRSLDAVTVATTWPSESVLRRTASRMPTALIPAANVRSEHEHGTIDTSCIAAFSHRSQQDVLRQVLACEVPPEAKHILRLPRHLFIDQVGHAPTRPCGFYALETTLSAESQAPPVPLYFSAPVSHGDEILLPMLPRYFLSTEAANKCDWIDPSSCLSLPHEVTTLGDPAILEMMPDGVRIQL